MGEIMNFLPWEKSSAMFARSVRAYLKLKQINFGRVKTRSTFQNDMSLRDLQILIFYYCFNIVLSTFSRILVKWIDSLTRNK